MVYIRGGVLVNSFAVRGKFLSLLSFVGILYNMKFSIASAALLLASTASAAGSLRIELTQLHEWLTFSHSISKVSYSIW